MANGEAPDQTPLRGDEAPRPAREARLATLLAVRGQHYPVVALLDAGGLVSSTRTVACPQATQDHDVVLAADLACDEPEALLRAWRMVTRRPLALEEERLARDLWMRTRSRSATSRSAWRKGGLGLPAAGVDLGSAARGVRRGADRPRGTHTV